MSQQTSYAFGGFHLVPVERALLFRGQALKVGSRAYDLLLVLVQHRDRGLSKKELLDRVWPGEVVEEANLAVQVLALRKHLGKNAIATLHGRGYRFALPVIELSLPVQVAHH